MYYDEESGGRSSFAAGLLIGALLGVGVALLAAPQSVRLTRRRLVSALVEAREAAGERWVDLSDDMRVAIRAGRRRGAE
jgi:gas vesicle protein